MSGLDKRPTLLITGASGGLASILTDMLMEDYRLVGIDPRPISRGCNFPGEFFQLDYTHRKVVDLFRRHRFSALVHLGRIRAPHKNGRNLGFDYNILGTRNLMDLAYRYGVKKIIVFSTYHVYGAHPHNPLYLTEEDPLRASQSFPELSDAVELDHIASTFLWKHRDVQTVILRPVNVIGPRINNNICRMLRSDLCPTLMGFDPLLQFIDESDIARALKLTLEQDGSGVFNVAGEGGVPYSHAIRMAGGHSFPLPAPLVKRFVGLVSRLSPGFPEHLVEYFRYPTIVSDASFRKAFSFEPRVPTARTLRLLRDSSAVSPYYY